MKSMDLTCFFPSERVREYHADRLGGDAAVRGGPLRVAADPAGVGAAGPGLEELRRRAGGAQRHPHHVLCLPAESRAGRSTGAPGASSTCSCGQRKKKTHEKSVKRN